MLRSLLYSFTNWDGIARDVPVGRAEELRHGGHGQLIPPGCHQYAVLIIIYVPVLNVVALLLAVAVYNAGRAGNVYKSLLFFPNLLSMTVVAHDLEDHLQLRRASQPVPKAVGLKILVRDWLGRVHTVLPAMSVTIIWFAVGYYLLIYLAGLNTVPVEIYESAEVEGVTPHAEAFPDHHSAHRAVDHHQHRALHDRHHHPLRPALRAHRGGPGYMSETLALHVYFYAFVQLQTSLRPRAGGHPRRVRHPHHLDPASLAPPARGGIPVRRAAASRRRAALTARGEHR